MALRKKRSAAAGGDITLTTQTEQHDEQRNHTGTKKGLASSTEDSISQTLAVGSMLSAGSMDISGKNIAVIGNNVVADNDISLRAQENIKQQQNVEDLSRDTENANGSIGPIFDKEKEQNRLREAQLIGEIGGQAMDIARTQGDIIGLEAALKANPKLKGDAEALRETKEYKAEMQKYGTGSALQQGLQAATAAIQGLAGGDMAKALAEVSAPYLAEVIKKSTGDNQAANLMAHAVLGAVIGQINGNSALAGASGAVMGEYIAQQMYPGIKREDLTEDQRQTISALGTLAAGLAGGLAGNSTADAVAGAQAGKNAVENNELNNLGDIFGSQGSKYFEGAASLEKELLQDTNLTDQEKQTIRDQYIKGDLPEDVIKAILENNPGSDTVMALLNAKNPEDYALALLSSLPAERALALIGKMTKGAQVTGVFNIADRVYAQLNVNDPRLGSLSGKLNAAELQKLANNPAAVRVYDTRSGHINVIQSVDGKLLRITVPNNEMKIISVGPIRPNQVKNLIEKGSFVPLP